MELEELIRFENENTGLDFKAGQYPTSAFESLIKDIMAMANAHIVGDRYIVCGVKHRPDGTREFRSIDEKDFVDAATYQQLLHDNVEPEIHLDYSPKRIDGNLLGVFRIYDCTDRPYMMRKAFGKLQQGDAFIRRGTHQARLTRQDIDRINADSAQSGFRGAIRIGFDVQGWPIEVSLPTAGDMKLPSDQAAERIRAIIAARVNPPANELDKFIRGGLKYDAFRSLTALGRAQPYELRPTDELEHNLQNIKSTYAELDLYTKFEVKGAKFDIVIVNDGDSYVEDSTFVVEIPRLQGLEVADEIHREPPEESTSLAARVMTYAPRLPSNYPLVIEHEQHIEIRERCGDLRHGIPKKAFERSIRIALSNELVGETIEMRCKLFGKQLPSPRTQTLLIHVTAPADANKPSGE